MDDHLGGRKGPVYAPWKGDLGGGGGGSGGSGRGAPHQRRFCKTCGEATGCDCPGDMVPALTDDCICLQCGGIKDPVP